MNMTQYLGRPVTELLEAAPFKDWPVERSVERDLEEPIVEYIFEKNGVELRCDANEAVKAIFLFSRDYGGCAQSLSEIPFSLTRKGVLAHFGRPTRSGERLSDAVLGEYGPWDRFERPGAVVIHVEYRADADEIDKITLLCAEDGERPAPG